MEPSSSAELLQRTHRVQVNLSRWQLVVGTAHRPYANLMLLCMSLPEPGGLLQPQRLLGIADTTTDSLRFYFLGKHWQAKVEHHGAKATVDLTGPLVF
jgi:hypothetical protein